MLSSMIETTKEYVEDPKNEFARDENGDMIRMKVKIHLKYFQGSHPLGGVFNNISLNI